MMKGTFVPYGFVLAPIGASLVVLFSVFVFTNGLLELLLGSAASFAFGLGMLEAFGVYPIIGTARAPSVQATRNVMRVGFLLLVIQLVFLLVPETAHRAFSVQIPFSQSLEWIGLGILLLSGYLLGGATWVVWDRWRQISAVVLEIPTWTRPSLQSWVLVLGFAFATPGFILNSILPSVSLVLFSVGAVLLLVGILPRKTKEGPRVQTTDTSTTSELRKTAYAEKSSLGKRACELILQKYGRRRVFAVCMWGDETENSQPYYGLNLLVVVRDGLRIPAQHYLLNGLEVSVYYWEEISILHQARTFTEEWPWRSDNYRTRIVLHEKNGWLRKLDAAVQKSESADPTVAVRESALLLVGHLGKLRDAQLTNNTVEMKAECWRIAWGAIELTLLLNRRYVRRDYWKEVFECPLQTPDLRNELELLLELTPSSTEIMAKAAEKLSAQLFEMVGTRGISLASSELKV